MLGALSVISRNHHRNDKMAEMPVPEVTINISNTSLLKVSTDLDIIDERLNK